MSTLAAVAHSAHRDSAAAAREVAATLSERLGGEPPQLVLAFATCGYDQDRLISTLRQALGEVPLCGCSAEGVLTADGTDEGSHALAVMALRSEVMRFSTFSVRGVGADSLRAGRELGERVRRALGDHAGGQRRALFVFPDSLTCNCSQLLRALEAELPDDLSIAGGTAGDMMKLEKTYQYHDGDVFSDGVSALLISGEVDIEIAVSHGCDVIGLERTVTSADGSALKEVDGQPAWPAFSEYLTDVPEQLRGDHISRLAIAERLDEPCDYGTHIVRVPLRVDHEHKGLIFGADMTPGTRVSMTRRLPERVVENTVASARKIAARHSGRAPTFVLQLDCAGRGRQLFGERCTEMGLRPIQSVLGHATPWLGCYTYGEIASPGAGRVRFHNYTVVLCAVYA